MLIMYHILVYVLLFPTFAKKKRLKRRYTAYLLIQNVSQKVSHFV